nr:histidine kinase N-terminal 7TM domain-containing protein [Haloarchaeobius litoreus]
MLFSAVVAVTIAVIVRRRDDATRGGRWFVVSLLGIAFWTTTQAASTVAASEAASVAWLKLTFVGSAVAGVALLLFTLSYTGRDHLVTPGLVGALAVEPLVALGLVFTTERHGLVHESIGLDPATGRLLVVEHAAWFYVHLAYMSVLLAVTTALLLQLSYRARNLYRGQAVAILVALVLPWAGTFVDGILSPRFTVTEPSFALSVVALWVGLFRYDLVEVPPVARSQVLETLSEGVLVVNERGQLIDSNPAAERLLDIDETVVGEPVAEALSAHPALRCAVEAETPPEEPVSVETGDGRSYVEVERADLGSRAGAVSLLQDVTDRIEHERELERQNERLDQFARVVSHDLRNPLNVADGYVELLADHVDDEEGTAYIEEVRTSHERMDRIVEDVLALARDGEAVDDPSPVPVESVVTDAWAQVDTADATLVCDLDRTVSGDRSQLQRSFENLFRNAVEHGGRSVTVTVDAIDDGDGFFVADDGHGIPPEEREQVVESGYSSSDSGTGLGLSIVDSVVRAHGWTLTVGESDAGGARFEVRNVEFVAPTAERAT